MSAATVLFVLNASVSDGATTELQRVPTGIPSDRLSRRRSRQFIDPLTEGIHPVNCSVNAVPPARRRVGASTVRKLGAALTALVLLFAVSASAVSAVSTSQPVVIANGWSPSDVGTAAPLAASLGGSVLYANTDSLGDPTVDALTKLKPSEIILVGGTKALTADIETELGQVVPNVPVTRLAGDDRIHTAALAALHALDSATSQSADTEAAKTAATGPGDAQDQRNGYSEERFTVGNDLRAGVWQFSAASGTAYAGTGLASDRNAVFGAHCITNGDSAQNAQLDVNGQPVRGDRHSRTGTDTYRFGLLDGDIVTLQAAFGEICEIEWVRD